MYAMSDSTPVAIDAELESVGPIEDPYDDDLVALHAFAPHMFDDLDPLERAVVAARFGVNGVPVRSMRELRDELDLPTSRLREALGSGLSKIRSHLRS